MTKNSSIGYNNLLFIASGFITSLICILISYVYYLYNAVYIMIIPYTLITIYGLVPLFVHAKGLNERNTMRFSLNFVSVYTIMIVSITLVFSTSFAQSPYYVFGYDINKELYFGSKVVHTHYWDVNIKHPYNSVVSITLLLPILSLLSHIDVEVLLKIVYPILYCFTFLILYKLHSMRLNVVLGYSSILIVLYFFTSFTELLALGRQMIAEFLLALFILSTVRNLDSPKFSSILASIIVLIGLALSHYATAFILSFVLLAGIILLRISTVITSRYHAITPKYRACEILVYIFFIVTFVWYNSIAQGINILHLSAIIKSISDYISEILNPEYSQAYAYITVPTTLPKEIARFILLIATSVISIGVVVEIFRQVRNRVSSPWQYYFILFALPFFMLDSLAIILPFISNALNATRLYQLSLLFLAQYFGVGYEFLSDKIKWLFSRRHKNTLMHNRTILRLPLLIFIILYAISNTGILSIVMNDRMMPSWLNPVASPSWKQAEIFSATWLINNLEDLDNTLILIYDYNFPLFLRFESVKVVIIKSQKIDIEVNNAKIETFFSGRTVNVYGYFPELNYFGSAPVLQLTPCLSHFICRELIRSSTILATGISSIHLL